MQAALPHALPQPTPARQTRQGLLVGMSTVLCPTAQGRPRRPIPLWRLLCAQAGDKGGTKKGKVGGYE